MYLGSEIRDPGKTYSESRIQIKNIPDSQHTISSSNFKILYIDTVSIIMKGKYYRPELQDRATVWFSVNA
jgi:hypothetical protein